jgi:cytochrome c peroxidase
LAEFNIQRLPETIVSAKRTQCASRFPPPRDSGPPPDGGRTVRQRLWIGLLAAVLAGEALIKTPPIPEAGLLAQPKPLDQVGFPAELTRQAISADNRQTPEKIALGEKLFFDGRLSADGTVACSTCHDPARASTGGRAASMAVSASARHRPS